MVDSAAGAETSEAIRRKPVSGPMAGVMSGRRRGSSDGGRRHQSASSDQLFRKTIEDEDDAVLDVSNLDMATALFGQRVACVGTIGPSIAD